MTVVAMVVLADMDVGVSVSVVTMMSVVTIAWVSVAVVSIRWLGFTFVDTMLTTVRVCWVMVTIAVSVMTVAVSMVTIADSVMTMMSMVSMMSIVSY